MQGSAAAAVSGIVLVLVLYWSSLKRELTVCDFDCAASRDSSTPFYAFLFGREDYDSEGVKMLVWGNVGSNAEPSCPGKRTEFGHPVQMSSNGGTCCNFVYRFISRIFCWKHPPIGTNQHRFRLMVVSPVYSSSLCSTSCLVAVSQRWFDARPTSWSQVMHASHQHQSSARHEYLSCSHSFVINFNKKTWCGSREIGKFIYPSLVYCLLVAIYFLSLWKAYPCHVYLSKVVNGEKNISAFV